MGQRDVAIFESGDLVGFEETMRDHILEMKKEEAQMKNKTKSRSPGLQLESKKLVRDFSLICTSAETEVLFFSQKVIQEHRVIKYHDIRFI